MLDTEKIVVALRDILISYPTAISNRTQMKALLLDYLPNERMTQNILLLALDEEIVSELITASSVDNISFCRYVKALTGGYGISEEYAQAAVRVWGEALGVDIQLSLDTEAPTASAAPEVNWQDTGDEESYEYEPIDGGVRITKFVGFDEPEIVIPNMIAGKRVLAIGNYAFRGCIAIDKVIIFEGINVIGNGAFKDIESLREVVLPSTLKRIGSIDTTGYIDSWERSTPIIEGAFTGTGLVSITIPESVNQIRERTFSFCKSLEYIKLPCSLSDIKTDTFWYARKLARIEFPRKLRRIGSSAFHGCESLTELNLPDGLEEIGDKAFYDCKKLSSITIPSSVQKIGTKQTDDEVFGCKYNRCPVTIYCDPGSYAMDYARRNGIKCAKRV